MNDKVSRVDYFFLLKFKKSIENTQIAMTRNTMTISFHTNNIPVMLLLTLQLHGAFIRYGANDADALACVVFVKM